jgi:hypothetical protein
MTKPESTVLFNRALNLFRITNGERSANVPRSVLLSIGDMDIRELADRAETNPYQIFAFKQRRAVAAF